MANFNYFKARELGYSDAEIAEHLAQERQGFNIGKARESGYSDREIIGHLAYGLDPSETTSGKAALKGAKQGFTDFFTGLEQLKDSPTMVGKFFEPLFKIRGFITEDIMRIPAETPEEATARRAKDVKDEFTYEMYKDQGYAPEAMGGYAVGTIAQPFSWVGGGGGKAIQLAKEAAALGGIQGLVNPVYENDTDGGRIKDAAIGTGVGFFAGLGLGKAAEALGKRFGKQIADEVQVPKDTPGSGMADELKKAAEPSVTGVPKATDELGQPLVAKVDETTGQAIPPGTTAEAVDQVETTVNQILAGYDIKLPPELAKAAPRYGRDVVGFESDLDRALYIVRDGAKRSNADQKYMDWIKSVTGIEDEALIRSLGGKVKAHVAGIPDKGVIPPSNLEIKVTSPQLQTATATVTPPVVKPTPENPFPTLTQETPPYVGRLNSVFVDNTKAWDSLDNVSKNLYNIGRKLNEAEALGARPSIKANEYMEAGRAMKQIFPQDTPAQIADKLKTYADFVDELGKSMGKEFTAPSLTKILEDGIDEIHWQAMFKEGTFDGCNLL